MPSVRPRTIANAKRPVKDERLSRRIQLESKESMTEPKVEVITENVLVPVTKAILTGKKFHRTTYRPKRDVQLVRLCRSNDNNVTRALLKRPTTNNILTEYRRNNNPGNRTISKILFPVINGHFERFKRFDRRSKRPRHKRMESESESESESLPFPCPISAVRAASVLAVTRSVDVSSLTGRTEKHEKTDKQTSNIVSRNKEIWFESKEAGKLVDDRSSANAATLNFDDFDDLDDLDDLDDFDDIVKSMKSSLCYRDTPDLSIQSRNSICMVPIATSTRPSTIRCCDSALTKIGLTVNLKRRTLSGGYVAADRGEQESSRYSVELSTPKRDATIFETLSSRSHQKIPGSSKLSVRDPAGFARDATDRSAFTFLLEDSAVPENGRSCKIKYSWQAIGRGSQTSRALLENFIEANGLDGDETIHQCGIKYSWQIIGIGTQTSKRDLTVAIAGRDPIATRLLANALDKGSRRRDVTNAHTPATIYRNGKRFILLNNQCTQTISHKENQTNFLEIHQNYH